VVVLHGGQRLADEFLQAGGAPVQGVLGSLTAGNHATGSWFPVERLGRASGCGALVLEGLFEVQLAACVGFERAGRLVEDFVAQFHRQGPGFAELIQIDPEPRGYPGRAAGV